MKVYFFALLFIAMLCNQVCSNEIVKRPWRYQKNTLNFPVKNSNVYKLLKKKYKKNPILNNAFIGKNIDLLKIKKEKKKNKIIVFKTNALTFNNSMPYRLANNTKTQMNILKILSHSRKFYRALMVRSASKATTLIGASLILNYALYHNGYIEWADFESNLEMEAFVGTTVAFYNTAFFAVAYLGTSSTGTAIGGLSGAAAVNAVNAWFAGGSIATGGWGATAGGAILAGSAFVAAAIVVGAGSWYWDSLKEKEKIRLMKGRIALVTKLLNE